MVWNGRSSRPALAETEQLQAGTHVITFRVPFGIPPTVNIPTLPDGVSADVGEVTTTGFTITVHGEPADTAASGIEWLAADTSPDTPIGG